MISLVHEHNRTMNAHHAAKRARLSSAPTAPQPQLAGAPHLPLPCLSHLLCMHTKQGLAALRKAVGAQVHAGPRRHSALNHHAGWLLDLWDPGTVWELCGGLMCALCRCQPPMLVCRECWRRQHGYADWAARRDASHPRGLAGAAGPPRPNDRPAAAGRPPARAAPCLRLDGHPWSI